MLYIINITLYFYINFGKNKLASPKNKKNPSTSVAVVKKIEDEIAGSTFNFSNIIGIINPKKPEIIKFPIIARNIINPRYTFD